MAAKQWFSLKSSNRATVVYLMSADSIDEVRLYADRIGGKSIVTRLTWWQLHDLVGGVIPAGSNPHSLASGNFMLLRLDKPDIVLWPI